METTSSSAHDSTDRTDVVDEERAMLISASYDQSIRIWDIASTTPLVSFTHKDSQVNSMQISPDTKQLVVGGWQHLKLYDLQTTPPQIISSCDSLVKNVIVGFEERGKWIYTGGEDCTTKIWDFRCNLHCRRIFQVTAPVSAVALHPNQVILAVTDTSGALYFWDLRRDTSETFKSLGLDISEYIVNIDINRAGDTLIGVTNRGKVVTWSLGLAEINPTIKTIVPMELKSKVVGHTKYGLKCHFSPNSRNFVTTGADGCIHLWDCSNPVQPCETIQVPEVAVAQNNPDKVESRWVWDCAFTSDSKYLFGASGKQLRLWNLETKEVVRQFQGHSKTITALAFKEMKRR